MIGAALAIYGTYVLNGLRSELHEAKKFGQYQIREKIGAGGMGEVYLAEHQLLKRPCALKLIKPEAGADPIALARFEREVQAAARLSHPNTIEIYDYGHTDDGTFYYVMEYLPGISLQDLVKQVWSAAGRPGDLPVPAGLRRSGRGPFAGPDPPRLEAGKRFRRRSGRRGRRRQGTRLRAGEADKRHGRRRAHERPEGQRHAALHVARAGDRRPVARRARRHLRSGLHDVFRADRSAAVSGRHAIRGDDGPCARPGRRRRPSSDADVPADLEQVVLTCLAEKPDDRYPDVKALGKALAACAAAAEWDAEKAQEWWARVCSRSAGNAMLRLTESAPKPPSDARLRERPSERS